MNRSRTNWSMLFGVILLVAAFTSGAMMERAGMLPGSIAQQATSATAEFNVFWEAWRVADRHFVDREALDAKEMTYGAIQGMLMSLGDYGHTRFLSPEALREEQDALAGRLEGIGAHFTVVDGRPTIIAPIAGSPAQRAGLRPGDIIERVDGQEILDLTLDELVHLVRGPEGTEVTLTVLHKDSTTLTDITVERAKIDVRNVTWTMAPGTSVAHVLIGQFGEKASSEMTETLREVRAAGASALILDLRSNPGGIRDEAVAVASQFIAEGNVLIEEDAEGNQTKFPVKEGGEALDIPMVVLINEGSASSAEIVSGALQDHQRGKLIGMKTFGTGTVLEPFNLSDGSAILLGTRQWLTPDGRQIWHQGIEPDIRVELPRGTMPLMPEVLKDMTQEQLSASTDSQLLRALQELGAMPVPAT